MTETSEESESATGRDGDPVTMRPRLHCVECGEWVYATSSKHTGELVLLECECRYGRTSDDHIPEVWERAF